MINSIACICASVILISCINHGKNEHKTHHSKKSNIKIESNEDFENFSNLFFDDIDFQLSRIKFPLRGNSTDYVFDENTESDVKNDTFSIVKKKYYWNKQGWVKLNKFKANNDKFKLETIIEEGKITKKIKSADDDFVIIMEFDKIQGQWFLTYYSSEWF
jgi:hypothetical protein